MFAIFNFSLVVYVYFFVIETKGRSLEEMESRTLPGRSYGRRTVLTQFRFRSSLQEDSSRLGPRGRPGGKGRGTGGTGGYQRKNLTLCPVAFATRKELKRHQSVAHSKGLAFRCRVPDCTKAKTAHVYNRRDNFVRHLRTAHAGGAGADIEAMVKACAFVRGETGAKR